MEEALKGTEMIRFEFPNNGCLWGMDERLAPVGAGNCRTSLKSRQETMSPWSSVVVVTWRDSWIWDRNNPTEGC